MKCSKNFTLTVGSQPIPPGGLNWADILWADSVISKSGSGNYSYTPAAGVTSDSFTVHGEAPTNPGHMEVRRIASTSYTEGAVNSHIHLDITKSVPNNFQQLCRVTIRQALVIIWQVDILTYPDGVFTVDADFTMPSTGGVAMQASVQVELVLGRDLFNDTAKDLSLSGKVTRV